MTPVFYPPTRLRLKPSLHPRAGYRFKDELGVTHVASNLTKLAESVRLYRKRLKKPPGEPMQEITEQICKAQPELCSKNTSQKPTLIAKALVSHVVHDIKRTLKAGPMEKATPEEIQRRADICATCPYAINWADICRVCQTVSTESVNKILAPDKPNATIAGKCCVQGRDELAIAAARLNPRPVAEAPANCWRKET